VTGPRGKGAGTARAGPDDVGRDGTRGGCARGRRQADRYERAEDLGVAVRLLSDVAAVAAMRNRVSACGGG
jgi:hypothetical protein